jgi:hypothetical protein
MPFAFGLQTLHNIATVRIVCRDLMIRAVFFPLRDLPRPRPCIRAVTFHPLTPNLALISNGKQGKVKRWIFWKRLTLR